LEIKCIDFVDDEGLLGDGGVGGVYGEAVAVGAYLIVVLNSRYLNYDDF